MTERDAAHRRAVQQYYDNNTPRFLRYGAQRQTRTIHRAVWGEGVQDGQAALQYSNNLVLRELEQLIQERGLPVLRTADLGCGVGASLFYLAERLPGILRGLGLTISPVQAELARRESSRLNLGESCAFVLADYLSPPIAQICEAAFAIEAFTHAPDARRFFQAAASILTPGGRLLLCDDFQVDQTPEAASRWWLEVFRWGWRAPSVLRLITVHQIAAEAGLELIKDLDLTGGLRLRSLPGWLTRWLVAVYRGTRLRDPYWRSVLGGQALQQCYRRGLVTYRLMVFEKQLEKLN